MIKLSYINSDDRKYNIQRCLSLIKSEVIAGLKNARSVVIKPNCVTGNNQLAATHADALDAVLAFIRPHIKGQVILAEGSGIGHTLENFKNYDYLKLQDRYDLEIVDLNTDEGTEIELVNKKGGAVTAQIAKTIANSDCVISVCPPKTHDCVVYTGSIKNVTVGALLRPYSQASRLRPLGRLLKKINYKTLIHEGNRAINENIFRIFKHVNIGLTIIDGFETMEGKGPLDGEMVPTHFALASTNPIAADWLASQCLGIKTGDIGYLSMVEADKNSLGYFVVGDDWKQNITDIKMHPNFETIRHWQ